METATPTVLWRLIKVPGEHARAVILPGGPPYTLAFFSDDQMDRVENFEALEIALFRADEIRRSLMDDGFVEDQ
ncbi:MAG: hypothetical protein Q8O42_11815 [Acidobacteriota bacterium]|nr:hypothetical protein [Acidobacteriota bacterium]